MIMIIKNRFVYCVLLSLLFLPACEQEPDFNQAPAPVLEEKAIPFSSTGAPVNSIGNTNENGCFFALSDTVYGLLQPGREYFALSKQISSEDIPIILKDFSASNIVVVDSYLYYMRTEVHPYAKSIYESLEEKGIYRIDLNSLEVEKIVSDAVSCFYIYQDKIYYQISSGDKTASSTSILNCSLDGTSSQIIFQTDRMIASIFSIYSGWLCIPTQDCSLILFELECQSTIEVALVDFFEYEYIDNVVPTEFGVLFLASKPSEKKRDILIYNYATDEINTLVSGMWCTHLTFDGSTIYFLNENAQLFMYNLQTAQQTLLLNISETFNYMPDYLNIVNGKLYCITRIWRRDGADSDSALFVIDIETKSWKRIF